MQPTQNQVHVDAVLTNISVAYIQSAEDFIAGRAFPELPVNKQSDIFFKYNKDDWFRDEAQPRADGTESAGSGYGLSQDTYSCRVDAMHKDVGDQSRANSDSPLDLDRDATNFVTQRLLLRREKQWVGSYFKTGIWGTDITGVASSPSTGQVIKWSDHANSDPIKNVKNGKLAVKRVTGFTPNTLILALPVYSTLEDHPDIVDRIKYVSKESVSPELLAQLFGVRRILIASAVENTGNEGETGSYSFTHGNNALLCYVPDAPGILTPSAGYTFTWKGVSGGLGKPVGVSRFRMQNLKADRIEGEIAHDCKLVAADLGHFFSNIVD